MQGQFYLLFILILLSFYKDMKQSRIPNVLTSSGAAAGLIYHTALGKWNGFLFAFLGCSITMLVMLILFLLRALGAGDVKLFGAVGALAGLQYALQALMYSIIFAGIAGILILLLRGELILRLRQLYGYLLCICLLREPRLLTQWQKGDFITFPFMYAVLPGVLTAYLEWGG